MECGKLKNTYKPFTRLCNTLPRGSHGCYLLRKVSKVLPSPLINKTQNTQSINYSSYLVFFVIC